YEMSVKTKQARVDVQNAVDSIHAGGSGFFALGGRIARSLKHFLDLLGGFARQRLIEDLLDAQVQCFRRLNARLEEGLRDLAFCRHRLSHLQQYLATPTEHFVVPSAYTGGDRTPTPTPVGANDPLPDALRGSPIQEVVLPGGGQDLDRAAVDLVSRL